MFKYSVVFAGNTRDIMLTHDHADNSSLFPDYIESLAIFNIPKQLLHPPYSSIFYCYCFFRCYSKSFPSVV